MDWQPAESAPKDGNPILVYYRNGKYAVVFWNGGYWEIQIDGAQDGDFDYWHRLEPPRRSE
jgi:hypothetical protein